MGILSLVLGIISTIWALVGGMWVAALIGVLGAILALLGIKRKAMCAPVGLLLSVNGVAWSMLYMVYEQGIDPIAGLLGLG